MTGRVVLVLTIVSLGATAPCAVASTVTGATDPSVPLVIDPGSGGSSVDIDLADTPKVAFVVPKVDRVVSAVTVGNFAQSSTCSGPAYASLTINEHPNGSLSDDGGGVRSTQTATIGAAASQLTFAFHPVVLRAGVGYSFRLTWDDPSACRWVSETSWLHSGSQVDSGSVRCQSLRNADTKPWTFPSVWRMYHVKGVDDRVNACDNETTFDPQMPSGWLMTISRNGYDIHPMTTDVVTNGPPGTGCGDLAGLGGHWVSWKSEGGRDYYVCVFARYADPNAHVADGWYFGLPWRQADESLPRDPYLKLQYRPQDGASLAMFPAGPDASELYGTNNPAEPNICSCQHADPVNSATGNLAEPQQDMAIPGRGAIGLPFTRTYNSQAAATAGSPGAMGCQLDGSPEHECQHRRRDHHAGQRRNGAVCAQCV